MGEVKKIKKVGVVGCGVMGSGIAQVCAQSGYETVVAEINEELLQRGLRIIEDNLSREVAKGRLAEEKKREILGRIKGTLKLEDFADCDLVIEAVMEKMEEKKKVFAALDQICPPHTILGSNTSCLSITEMAMATKRPDKVLGIHFMNPVPVMRLVELVRTILTSEETLNTARSFSESLGKTVVVAGDAPGFIVNRLLIPFLFEAVRLYESGFASKEDIDTGIRLGLNHPMGPLTLLDLIGLDTALYIGEAMYEEFKDEKFAPPPLLKRMVTAGWLGRKTGKGFYEYK